MKRNLVPFFGSMIAFLFMSASDGFSQAHFLRGDSNHDRVVDLSDAIFTVRYLFEAGGRPACADAADVDDNGKLDMADVVRTLSFLFAGGPPPEAPYPIFEGDPTPDDLDCLPEVEGSVTQGGSILVGDITQDVTLRPDKTYRMVGRVIVREGATLRIEAGVTILGDSGSKATLIIDRGARIEAVGTRTHPVVFTSDKPVGSRRRGDWCGIILLGRAPNDLPGGQWVVKGYSDLYAGGGANPDPNDSSGRMSYVRIGFGGAEISPGVPLSGISFMSVGAGTQLDHILAKYIDDDGIEWYGGTCSLKYGFSLGVEDEGFDCQFGWQGRGQFLLEFQTPDAGNRGFQVGDQPSGQPRTFPVLSNVTMVGTTGAGSRSDSCFLVQYNAGLTLYNAIIQGWPDAGLELRDIGPVTVDRCVFYKNRTDCKCRRSPCLCSSLFSPPLQNVLASRPVLGNVTDLQNPDLRGIESELPPALDPSSIDPWFDPVDYVGAVPPEGKGKDWTKEPWISWLPH